MKKLLLFLGGGLALAAISYVALGIYFSYYAYLPWEESKVPYYESLIQHHKSQTQCAASDIEITSIKLRMEDECRTESCAVVKGVATLKNNCRESVGVQIKAIGMSKTETPLAARDFWPASVNNIPPGEYVFSLDQVLDYQPEMKRIDLSVKQVKVW